MKIGFIGLGNMGAPMARNLIKAGHELIVFDLSTDALSQLREAGAHTAQSVSEIARMDNIEVIITMLPASQHVRSVYLSQEGLLSSVSKEALLIDCSTIDPQTAREVAKVASEQGNSILDAPVSGGTGGAEAGTLTFMVGGSKQLLIKHNPYCPVWEKILCIVVILAMVRSLKLQIICCWVFL